VAAGSIAAAAAAVGAVVDDALTTRTPAHDEAAEPQTLIPNTGQWRTVAASADLTEGAVHGFDLGTVRLADRKPA
jgi:hypothetical protein